MLNENEQRYILKENYLFPHGKRDMKIKYVHTNVVALDWQHLADFYMEVFGCQPVPPKRDLAGERFEALTGIKGARAKGIHLRLPGYEDNGPTLEIFQYTPYGESRSSAPNNPGYAHIAFLVDQIAPVREKVLSAGGKAISEIVTLPIAPGAKVTVCYLTDPEGNIIELQSWSEQAG